VTYEIPLRDNGPRYVIRIADGAAEVRAAGGLVDCVISANPVTFLLVGSMWRANFVSSVCASDCAVILAVRYRPIIGGR
jgi:hypothetical protein